MEKNMEVQGYEFLPVTEKNRKEILKLSLHRKQRHYIETTKECLEEARMLSIWRPVGIYMEKVLLGFGMYGKFEDGRVWLDRFLIDKAHQGKGHGGAALRCMIDRLAKEYHCGEIYLSLYEDNRIAMDLYEKAGFRLNGELDTKGEKVMVLKIEEGKAGKSQ